MKFFKKLFFLKQIFNIDKINVNFVPFILKKKLY